MSKEPKYEFIGNNPGYRRQKLKYINGWHYKTLMKLAALTEYVPFDCQFDKNGICKNYRRDTANSNSRRVQCCCGGCGHSRGYLYVIPDDKKMIAEYKKLFDGETGFWRAGKGCILPRSHRSPTCVTYNCDNDAHDPSYAKKFPARHYLLSRIRNANRTMIKGKRYPKSISIAEWLSDLEAWLKEEM